ncbi:hypothetical protein GSI_02756 [Ganoderma sinense ZZ0214-1]|uniref:Uncharacterized protein n=1 Tax=Ganoderma sinense ZZ0214-1 TaxID=1077348 RepID=A0A2G8SMJ6_9APHY|nr:hypothetical protein GSI_02756 [Ganoderma sinense ZZ0214-1]
MVDGVSSTLLVPERLQRLRQYSANFRNGIFDHENVDSHPEYVRRFRNVRWGYSTRPKASSSALFGALESAGSFLTIFTRGSSQAGVPSRRWMMPAGTPGDRTRWMEAWAIDRAQDLLVTVEVVSIPTNVGTSRFLEVRFCSLSGSETVRTDHPAAALPCVQVFPQPGTDGRTRIDIHPLNVGASYVVWKLGTTRGQAGKYSIEVFNWKAGEFVSRIDLGTQRVDVALLDDTHLVVLPESSESSPPQHINVYTLSPSAASRPPVTLQLPDFQSNSGERAVSHHLNNSRNPPDPEAHFYGDPSHSMVVLTCYIGSQSSQYVSHLLIPYSALLAQANGIAANTAGSPTPPDGLPTPVPWQDWGAPRCLRLRVPLPVAHPGRAQQHTALIPWGSRMPVFAFDRDGASPVVYVVDINPFVARHARTRHDDSNPNSNSESESESEANVTAIVEDVETALPGVFDPDCAAIPYVVYRFKIPPSPSGAAARVVRMSMTGFTVASDYGGRLGEAEETWTV